MVGYFWQLDKLRFVNNWDGTETFHGAKDYQDSPWVVLVVQSYAVILVQILWYLASRIRYILNFIIIIINRNYVKLSGFLRWDLIEHRFSSNPSAIPVLSTYPPSQCQDVPRSLPLSKMLLVFQLSTGSVSRGGSSSSLWAYLCWGSGLQWTAERVYRTGEWTQSWLNFWVVVLLLLVQRHIRCHLSHLWIVLT